MKWLLLILLAVLMVFGFEDGNFETETPEPQDYMRLEHPNNHELFNELKQCDADQQYCDDNFLRITKLCVKIANEHTALLLVDRAKRIFEDILYFSQPHTKLGQKAMHILSVISFGQGNVNEAEKYWAQLNTTNLVPQRTLAAQMIISGVEADGIEKMINYTTLLGEQFYNTSYYNIEDNLNAISGGSSEVATADVPTADKSSATSSDSGIFNIGNILFGSTPVAVAPIASNNGSSHNTTESIENSESIVTNGGSTASDDNINKSDSGNTSTSSNTSSSISSVAEVDLEKKPMVKIRRSQSTEESEEFLLGMLLSEAQGGVRSTIKLTDLTLSTSEIRPLDARQRFRLGVGLAKLGLYDLSLKHVWLAATPWEAPLYRLRAQLTFASIHASIRALATTIDNFERQVEAILLTNAIRHSPIMVPICDNLNEAALALQSLPLLHFAGFASPRHLTALGHSPVALPVLLSEVYTHMCPAHPMDSALTKAAVATSARGGGGGDWANSKDKGAVKTFESLQAGKSTKYKIGVVSGSFDGDIGRIMIGLLESIAKEDRADYTFIAMCFPTPRDATTDRVNALFDSHINLSSDNKTQAILRIKETKPDFLLFTDLALDSRVFATAHERLALHQGIFWGFGGTLGIPTIDYYFQPEIFWRHSQCGSSAMNKREHGSPIAATAATQEKEPPKKKNTMVLPKIIHGTTGRVQSIGTSGNKEKPKAPPQSLYHEQVVLLENLPVIPRPKELEISDVSSILQNRYLLLLGNRTHLYILPCSVKAIHPEFDPVIEVILKTDPLAVIVITVPRTGRDNLPVTHIAIRYDLMHPAMSIATNNKFMQRLRLLVGNDETMLDRIRILPPLDEAVYRALIRTSAAVLDPFPVGLHIPILEAIQDRVPVISAYTLQECTNSHATNILSYLDSLHGTATSNGVSGGGVGNRAIAGTEGLSVSRVSQQGFFPSQQRQRQQQHRRVPRMEQRELHPMTAEEFGVLAIRINRDQRLRQEIITMQSSVEINKIINGRSATSEVLSHGMQMLRFFDTLRQ